MASPLTRWLAGRSPDELAAILVRRPDALAAPAVTDLGSLAARLQRHESVAAALARLPAPAVQLVEAMQALGGPAVPRTRLAELIGRAPDDAELAATLEILGQRALVWTDGDELRMAGALWSAFTFPLGLGLPAAELAPALFPPELDDMARLWRLPSATPDALVAALADPDRVRAMVAAAPAEVRLLLDRVAHDGPLTEAPDDFESARPDGAALEWAIRRGLLVWDGWRHAQLPREVGLALRGPHWRAPFAPHPPRLVLGDTPTGAVDRETVAAASTAVERVAAVVEAAAVTPVALLKAGGVGSRELRRLARAVGCDEPEVRLWLELAYAAGLLGVAREEVLPTDAYDDWAQAEPGARLPVLLRGWQRLPAVPLAAATGDTGRPPAALLRDGSGLAALDLRPALLRTLDELPPGRGITDPHRLADTLTWQLPLLSGQRDGALVAGLWREAQLVGVAAHGVLTRLGRALLHAPDTLEDVTASLLPASVGSAVFQNDLTVVVPGLPAAALAELLDAAARRESRGGAATWRFSAASVRAALDAGHEPSALLAALRRAAAGGDLPQTLEYLVNDVGRQHGRVRVRAVGCVLHADDPALVTEIAAARALRPLELRVLAPTVLASAQPMAKTLNALRAAGFAPIGEDGDGEVRVERPTRRRAPALRGGRAGSSSARGASAQDASGRDSSTPGRDMSTSGRVASAPGGGGSAPGRAGRADGSGDGPAGGGSGTGRAAAELAERLLATAAAGLADDPGGREFDLLTSPGVEQPALTAELVRPLVERHAAHLRADERALLVDATVGGGRVKIDYCDSSGELTTRVIEPLDVDRHLLAAWCHLRDDERMFALDRIESVSPA
ncbi:helicase-associated domain-containing protein [Polymorphospora sp. NPDC050346]|uniref:helicase-associated domain-containing protein n=1 Tax=Polymorphospora sp. NPDC050346 TaxID=3155780 RepID=UPI0033D2FE19